MRFNELPLNIDLLVSDFILPNVADNEIRNTKHINGRTKWYALKDKRKLPEYIETHAVIQNDYGIFIGINDESLVDKTHMTCRINLART